TRRLLRLGFMVAVIYYGTLAPSHATRETCKEALRVAAKTQLSGASPVMIGIAMDRTVKGSRSSGSTARHRPRPEGSSAFEAQSLVLSASLCRKATLLQTGATAHSPVKLLQTSRRQTIVD